MKTVIIYSPLCGFKQDFHSSHKLKSRYLWGNLRYKKPMQHFEGPKGHKGIIKLLYEFISLIQVTIALYGKKI